MTTDLAVPSVLESALSPSAIRYQVNLIQEVMKGVMEDGVHYGTIPGTPRPTLYKPGAEKLCLTFRLAPQFDSTETYDGLHLTIKSRCTLSHINTERRMGSGEGSCSTKESKYAYRQAVRKCPRCQQEAIVKGKADYGGGWFCYGKKGGCGAKFQAGDRTIEGQDVGRTPNEDLADSYNTVLKMANKRSLVAAVLNVTAASDIFTQDIEDLPHDEVEIAPPAPVKTNLTEKLKAQIKLATPAPETAQETQLETDLTHSLDAVKQKKTEPTATPKKAPTHLEPPTPADDAYAFYMTKLNEIDSGETKQAEVIIAAACEDLRWATREAEGPTWKTFEAWCLDRFPSLRKAK